MKCKHCKEKFEPVRFNMKYCLKTACIKAMNEAHWNKVRKPEIKRNLVTIQDLTKEAQKVFNRFIRLRDDGQACISCGRKGKKVNAGHYFSAGGHSAVRFDEDNVHLQCEPCNSFLSGNSIEYRKGLIEKIGIERFEALELRAYKSAQWTREELRELTKEYKQKIKEWQVKS